MKDLAEIFFKIIMVLLIIGIIIMVIKSLFTIAIILLVVAGGFVGIKNFIKKKLGL